MESRRKRKQEEAEIREIQKRELFETLEKRH